MIPSVLAGGLRRHLLFSCFAICGFFLSGSVSAQKTGDPIVKPVNKCIASPKPSSHVCMGNPVGDYLAAAVILKGEDADCDDSCSFRVKFGIMLDDGTGGGFEGVDTAKNDTHKAAYFAWHPGGGVNNIQWDFGGGDTETNNSSRAAKNYKVVCGGSTNASATISTVNPIDTTPASNPNDQPGNISISVDVTLSCSDCDRGTGVIIEDPVKRGGDNRLFVVNDQANLPSEFSLSLVPNGSMDQFVARFTHPPELPGEPLDLRIYDLQGKMVLQQTLRTVTSGRGQSQVRLGSLPSGLYVATLRQADGRGTSTRLVITR